VQTNVDALVVDGPEAILQAAVAATDTIPIAMIAVNFDPIARRYIASLARPGGNVTGVFFQSVELVQKQLDLLKQALPGKTQATALYDELSADQFKAAKQAAERLNLGPVQTAQGALGTRGRWESEAHRAFNWDPVSKKGTRKLANWDPICRIGTRNQQWGPAIDYNNVLGVKLCLLQLNVSPPQSSSGPLRRGNSQHFRFRISESQLQVAIRAIGTRNQQRLLMEPQLQFPGNSFQIRHSIGQLLQLRWMYHQERLIRKQCVQNPGSSSA
jgi:ABC transporter substrate binding protein